MIEKVLITVCVFASCVSCEWVKIPQPSSKPKVAYKIKTVASFADLPSGSALSKSDLLHSVFSYDKSSSSTTEMTLVTEASYGMVKKHFPSTVTSKTVNFKPPGSDRVDYEEMEQVKLLPVESETRKIIFLNQTVPMEVLVETGKKLQPEDDDEDDGVTMMDEDESLSSSEEEASKENYYEYEEATTTTTKAPRKRKPPLPKSQRRVMQMMNMKSRPANHLTFTSFLTFIRSIQETFATRTAKNINDKIKMLREFRDNLLLTINQRIKSLWKVQSKALKKKHRGKRTLGGGHDGWMEHGSAMDFPSAEGALLSISFLTFAVFLIKLVLVSFPHG